jgi:TonB family protein
MRKIFIFCLVLFMGSGLYAQNSTNDSISAIFPGNMNDWIGQHVRYPEQAKDMGDSGTVYVSFIIEADGKVSNVKIYKSVTPILDKEAIRVFSAMPEWTPGSKNGQPERQAFCRSVHFVLK